MRNPLEQHGDDHVCVLSYEALYANACVVAKEIEDLPNEEPILLLFDQPLEFLVTFLGCQLAGKVAVPMFYPGSKRHFKRLETIVKDCNSSTILCDIRRGEKIQKGLLENCALSADIVGVSVDTELSGRVPFHSNPSQKISFIQYTSGSTGTPKGVVVSHENLMHNLSVIQRVFETNEESVILSWLPFYHDMGLVGNLLQAIYVGCDCTILEPASVVQNPSWWLENIEKYKATHTGGPNFIFDFCVQKFEEASVDTYDLSSLQVVYNGSEQVKQLSYENFIRKFAASNLNPKAFKTCYGLAEATLMVTGGEPEISNDSISSGAIAPDFDVIFFDEKSGEVSYTSGEICLAGPSVTAGYWKKDNRPFFIEHKGKHFFRTGDIGELVDGALFCCRATQRNDRHSRQEFLSIRS